MAKTEHKQKPMPEFVQHRIEMWDEIEAKWTPPEQKEITITLEDGKEVKGVSWETTPLTLDKQAAKKAVVAKVNGNLWDLQRPLEGDCTLEYCPFDSEAGKHAFWHSSAHVLGQAIEAEFGANLCIGPPLVEDNGGFYYDCEMGDRKISEADYKSLEKHIKKLTKKDHRFQRLILTKAQALEMFKHNPFKIEIITNKIGENDVTTAYRCGPLIDLCRGPHIPSTRNIKAMTVTKNSSAYWLAKQENASLQRVYGMSFPDKKQLKEWKELQKEAAKRDHRRVGTDQKLIFFSQFSPGSAFFLPHGTRVYTTLQNFLRQQYRERGFEEVITPNIFNVSLWKQSGHYQNYKDDMFLFNCEADEYGMKPMNCPGHCQIFKSTLRSYRDLPIRLADFGTLHRNERSGALTGLTRVRRFQQDDAHIFCRADQIREEVSGALDFLNFVYSILGFEFSLCLSTRPPQKYMGSIELWDQAELQLAQCLDEFGMEWKVAPGDGAFYGPKIDILLTDALHRKHQCATIQLDFQLPLRFELNFKTSESKMSRPVIIHRAILGSFERMIAVLIEHTGGKWPFWLSPRQAIVVPVRLEGIADYAQAVQRRLWAQGYYVDVDLSTNQFKKKVRDAQLSQYNFILVVGNSEKENGSVNIRTRDNQVHGEKSVDDLLEEWDELKATYQ